MVSIRESTALPLLDMLFAQFEGKALLAGIMVESADVHFVAAMTITFNALVLVWMVKPLNCGVTLVTFEATWAVVPPHTVLEVLTVLRSILKEIRRSSEIACMMDINATF